MTGRTLCGNLNFCWHVSIFWVLNSLKSSEIYDFLQISRSLKNPIIFIYNWWQGTLGKYTNPMNDGTVSFCTFIKIPGESTPKTSWFAPFAVWNQRNWLEKLPKSFQERINQVCVWKHTQNSSKQKGRKHLKISHNIKRFPTLPAML